MRQETINILDSCNAQDLYNNGHTALEISEISGLSPSVITKYLKDKGVKMRRASKRESLRNLPKVGEKFGRFTVISTELKAGNLIGLSEVDRNLYCKVKCECGTIAWRGIENLRNGKVKGCKSCGRRTNNIFSVINSYYNRLIDGLKRRSVGKLPYDITPEFLNNLFEENSKCAYTNIDLSKDIGKTSLKDLSISLDRIDSSKGYVKDNVQWVHKDINMMKGSLTHDRFIELCKLVSENHK